MEIIVYIIELLNSKREVGVNGLGTFFKKKSPGRYDAQTHSFLPPSYSLAFTPEVKEHNHLAMHINKTRTVSLGTANYFITEFVTEVEQSLTENGVFEMPGIGTLSKSDTEILIFKPEAHVNFGYDFYALPSVKDEIGKTVVAEPETPQDHQEEDPQLESIVEENIAEEENPGDDTQTVTPTPTQEIDQPETGKEELISEAETIAPDNEDIEASQQEIIVDPTLVQETSVLVVDEHTSMSNEEEQTSSIIEEHPTYEEITEVRTPEEIIPKLAPREIETITPESSSAEAEESLADRILRERKEREQEQALQEQTITINERLAASAQALNTKSEDAYHHPATDLPVSEQPVPEERKGLSLIAKLLLVLFCILMLGAIVYFINPSLYQNLINKGANQDRKAGLAANIDPALKSVDDSLSFADSIMNTAKEIGLKVDKAKDTLKFTVKAETLNTTTYEIIGVAYKTQKEVDDYIARMKKRGYAAKAVDRMPGKMTKISLATYNNRDSARKDLDRFQKDLKNPGIYIYVNKDKE